MLAKTRYDKEVHIWAEEKGQEAGLEFGQAKNICHNVEKEDHNKP